MSRVISVINFGAHRALPKREPSFAALNRDKNPFEEDLFTILEPELDMTLIQRDLKEVLTTNGPQWRLNNINHKLQEEVEAIADPYERFLEVANILDCATSVYPEPQELFNQPTLETLRNSRRYVSEFSEALRSGTQNHLLQPYIDKRAGIDNFVNHIEIFEPYLDSCLNEIRSPEDAFLAMDRLSQGSYNPSRQMHRAMQWAETQVGKGKLPENWLKRFYEIDQSKHGKGTADDFAPLKARTSPPNLGQQMMRGARGILKKFVE